MVMQGRPIPFAGLARRLRSAESGITATRPLNIQNRTRSGALPIPAREPWLVGKVQAEHFGNRLRADLGDESAYDELAPLPIGMPATHDAELVRSM